MAPSYTEQERRALLWQIEALSTDHDAVDNSKQVFLPLQRHRLALRAEPVIVVGTRGAGKTALFRLANALGSQLGAFFEDPQIPQSQWVDAFSESKKHPAPPTLDEMVGNVDVASDTVLRAFWITHLLARLADEGVVGARIPAEIEQVHRGNSSNPSKWLGAAERNIGLAMSALDAVDEALAAKPGLVFASYDHLDRLGLLTDSRLVRQRLIRALLALWLSLSTRYRNLRAKIFLRPDLLEEAQRSFPDASKLRPRSVSLEWDVQSLYQLAVRHLANAGPAVERMRQWLGAAGIELIPYGPNGEFGLITPAMSEAKQRALASALAGDVMGKGPRKGFTYRWIPARLKDAEGRIVPRSFLRLLAHAAKETLSNPPVTGPLMEPKWLVAALQRTSLDRVNELGEEYPFVSRLEGLRGQTMLMEKRKVVDILEKEGPGGDGDKVFEELLRIGVLEVRKDGRIDVPDIYRYGYGIKRKGGAAAPR